MPVEQPDRMGDHAALGLRHPRRQVAQPPPLTRELVTRIGGEHGAPTAVDAEQHELHAVR